MVSAESAVDYPAKLINQTRGDVCSAPFQLMDKSRNPDFEACLGEISLKDVPAGNYFLYIYAADKVTGGNSPYTSLVIQ